MKRSKGINAYFEMIYEGLEPTGFQIMKKSENKFGQEAPLGQNLLIRKVSVGQKITKRYGVAALVGEKVSANFRTTSVSEYL